MVNLKNLKSLFVQEDTGESIDSPSIASPGADGKARNPSSSGSAHTASGDQRIMNALLKALEDNNENGFDFLEFKNSLKALSKMPLDEATRFRSAFATASTMGVTVKNLLDSVDYYKKVLSTEKDKFDKTLQDQVIDNVSTKEKQAEALNESIKRNSEEITRLTKEISSHQADLAKLKSAIGDAKEKIAATKNNFTITYNSMLEQINDDAGKIKTYLG